MCVTGTGGGGRWKTSPLSQGEFRNQIPEATKTKQATGS